VDLPRVFAVDDDPDLLAWVDAVLGDSKALITAESVEGALEILSAGTPFDLLILDMRLPDGRGTDILAAIAGREDLAHLRDTPAIMLTASRDAEDYLEAWDLGTVAWVEKPFSVEVLSAAIERALAERPSSSP
jgi:DNA-binding response OmpR family regulator